MFTKSVLKVGVAALMSIGFTACSQEGSSNNGDQPATAATAAGDYTPGTAVHTSKVIGTSESPVGTASSKEEIYAMFPELQKYASQLLAVDRVIETNTGDLELYSGNDLIIVLGHTADGLVVTHSSHGFQAEHIVQTMGSSDQNQALSTLSFDLKSCTAGKDQGQDQGQEQGQDKGEVAPAPDKGQEQGQDKGEVAPAPDKGQEQGQDKGEVAPAPDKGQEQGQDKGQVAPETCEMVNVTLSLSEEQTKQEQGQDKGEAAPAPDKGQEQGQDKGEATPAPDKGEQGQDKGEVAPAPDKGQEQGQEDKEDKGDQDQGKGKA